MLYLAIIGIVCAVSAPKDGIPQIGEKNYKSNSHYQFDEGGQTPIEQILPRLRNGTSVCYTKSANANDSNRTSSNLNGYFKNQCSVNKRNSSYNLVENLDTKETSKSFSIFKKRNLLWFEKTNREKMKKSHSTLSLLKPQKNREIVKLRKKNGKIYAKRKNKRRSLDKIKVDEEVDIRKQIQKLVEKIAANNMLREESSRVDVQKAVDRKRDENSNLSEDKRQKKKISGTEGRGGGSIRIKLFPETESVVVKFGENNDKMKLIMPTCSYSGKNARKARFRRNPKRSVIERCARCARGGCGYRKMRYYRNALNPLPHPRVVDNNSHFQNVALTKRNSKSERKSRYKNGRFLKRLDSLKRRLKKRSCFRLPKIGGKSESHDKKTGGTDDVENKKLGDNDDTENKKLSSSDDLELKKINVNENTDYRRKMKELLDESEEHSGNENPSKNYERTDDEDKVKKKEDQRKEGTVFQKPFLPARKNRFDEIIPLNEDRSLIPRSAAKSKLLANNKNLTPERYLKIRHALRSYLIENDAWGPNQRESFVEKRRRFKKGCSMPHKCWRAAPLLCIPYIRKGQDEMLKYIIKNLQKMLGKPFTRKIDIFEKTKFKPPNVKPQTADSSDDIIPGENEEECTTKNQCCSTTVCVPTTCPPTTTCATTTSTCRTTSTCAFTPSSEVTCGKGITFPLTTARNSLQDTTLAPSATLNAPPVSSTKGFFNMNTKTLPAYNTPRFSPRPIPLMTTPMPRTALAVSMRLGQFATTSRPLRVPNQPLLNTARAVSFACADSCPFDFSKAPIRQDEYYLFDPITEEDVEPSKNPLDAFDPQQNLMNHFKNQVNGFRTTPQWLHRLLNPAAFKQSMSYEDKENDKYNPTPDLDNQFLQEIQNQPYFLANSYRPRMQKHDMNQWMMQLKRPQENPKYGFQPTMEFFPAYDYDIVDKYPYMKYNMRYNKYRYPWLFHKNYGMKMKSSIGKNSKNQELKRQKRSVDWAPPFDKEEENYDDVKDDEASLERPQETNPKLRSRWRNMNLFRKSATTPSIFEMFSNLVMQMSNTEVNKEGDKGGKESKKSGKKGKSDKESSGGKSNTKKHKSKSDNSDESKNSGTNTTVTESKGTTDTEKGTESTVTDETTASFNKTVSPSTIITTNNALAISSTSASTIASTNANIIESTTASTTTTLTTMTKPSTELGNLTTLVQGLTKSNPTDENKSTENNLKSKSLADSNTTELTVNVKPAGSLSNATSSNTSIAMLYIPQPNTTNNSSALNSSPPNATTNGQIININTSTTNISGTGNTSNILHVAAVANSTDTASNITGTGGVTNTSLVGVTNTTRLVGVANTTRLVSETNTTGIASATNATGIVSATNATAVDTAANATSIDSATNTTRLGSATNTTGVGSATNTTGLGSATNTTGLGSATNTTGTGSAVNATDTGNTTSTSTTTSTPSTVLSSVSNALVTTISSNVGNVTNLTISTETTKILGTNVSTESIGAFNTSSEATETGTCPTSTEEECATTPKEEPKGNNTVSGAGNNTISGTGNHTNSGIGNSTVSGTGNSTFRGLGKSTFTGLGKSTFTGLSKGAFTGVRVGLVNNATGNTLNGTNVGTATNGTSAGTTSNSTNAGIASNGTKAGVASNDTSIPKTSNSNSTCPPTDSKTLPPCLTMDDLPETETPRSYKNKKKSKASSSSQLKKTESTTPEEEETGCPEACTKDKKEEGFVATTLKSASIVKGPKLIATKPAPRMFAKVYPETYPNSARNTENIPNDLGQTTVAPLKSILEKAILQPTTVAPDVRLQLLPVCEGYLEVVKLIKAQNQSLAAELDSELSQFCENIISQSFNLPEGNLPKKSYEMYPYALNGTYSAEVQPNQRELPDEQPMTTREFPRKTATPRGDFEYSTRKKIGQKRIDEVLRDYVDREERRRFQVNQTTTTIEGIEKRIRRKHEVSFEEMARKHKETLALLKKRKRELLRWLMNSQEKQEDGLYPEEAEYMEDYVMTRTTAKEVSGKVNHNGDEETFELQTAVANYPKINQISYPVYAKKYGYDKPGEIREVELIWRKVNRDTQEKELLKSESVMAFLYTPAISPYVSDTDKTEDEDLYEGQSYKNRNVLFTDIHVSVGKPVSHINFTPEYTIITGLTNATTRYNRTGVTKRPNATVTVHHNVTFLNPNMTKKIIKKVQEAKGKLQEYGIEFLNYAVYILPIMFSLLFLICCSCWFFDWWRRKHKDRRRKRKAKKEMVSVTDTDTSEQSEPRKKKKRRKRVKEADEDVSEGTKKYKRFWNPLKYQKGDYHEDNSVDNKFLRFLKMRKREMETHPKSEGRRSRIREADRTLDGQERKKEEPRSASTSKSRTPSRDRDSDDRNRVSNKLMKKKEFVKPDEQSEGNDRREIIALLDELKDIEMQQLGEKPTTVGYMTRYGGDKSGFDFSGFPMSYPREKYFPNSRTSNPFCEKHFRLTSREGSPTFENDEIANDNLDELEQLLPCKCNRYAIKNDFVRRPQYQLGKTGKCESFLKVIRDSCIPDSKNLYKKELKLFKDRSVYVNRYKSVSTETNDELLVGKDCDPEFSFTDNLLDELIPRKTIGLVSEKRQFTKKKCVRLKEGGVLCRL